MGNCCTSTESLDNRCSFVVMEYLQYSRCIITMPLLESSPPFFYFFFFIWCCDSFCFNMKMIPVPLSCSHERVWGGSGTDGPKTILPVQAEKLRKRRDLEEIACPLWPVVPGSDKRRCFRWWTLPQHDSILHCEQEEISNGKEYS